MKKTMLTALTLALVIGGATAVFAAVGDDPAPSGTARSTTVEDTTTTTTSTAEDVSGPCDEAEHANDPRCAGGAVDDHRGAGGHRADQADDDEIGEDIPGPCDEAEHANDPRCAPGGPVEDHGRTNNSGPDTDGSGSDNRGPSGEADDHGGESGHSGSGGGEGHDD